MGCDIHFVVEEKMGNDWVGVYTTENRFSWVNNDDGPAIHLMSRRNYAFFSALAGVRGPGPDPNGLPFDASQLTCRLVAYWDGDGHSHGHCSLSDFALKWEFTRHPLSESATNVLLGKQRTPEQILEEGNLENYRVCFWFDN